MEVSWGWEGRGREAAERRAGMCDEAARAPLLAHSVPARDETDNPPALPWKQGGRGVLLRLLGEEGWEGTRVSWAVPEM